MPNYDKKTEIKEFDVDVSAMKQRGYFEHNKLGDELAGTLWFGCEARQPTGS